MSGPQFVHFQTFSRKKNEVKQSVDQVLAEAARVPLYSIHVAEPLPPSVVFGVTVEEVCRLHDEMVANGGVEVTLTDGRKARRGIRKDRHTLMTVVASHPFLTELVVSDDDARSDYERWRNHNIAWLKARFGGNLVSVIEHQDEKHPHLHAYILPLNDPTCTARDLNPAWRSKEEAMAIAREAGHDAQVANKLSNVAYRSAAREIQDDYFQHVSVPCGLTRTGPKRRRFSRQQWAAEKAAAKLSAQVERDLEGRMVSLIEAEEGLDHALDDKIQDLAEKLDQVDQALADAERERSAAEKERRAARNAEADAKAVLSRAEDGAKRIQRDAEKDLARQRQKLVDANAAREAQRLEAERHRLAQDHDRRVRDGIQEAVQLSMKLLIGVLDGSVRQNPQTRGWIVEDNKLREQSRSLKLISQMGSALTAVRDTWDRLKSKLTDAEQQAAREQAKAPIKEAAKAPPREGFSP
jgi:hypothetical protein